MRTTTLPVWAAVALLIAACGLSSSGEAIPEGGWSVITSDQMLAANAESVYDAVQRLRPDWLTTRGPTSLSNSTPAVPSVFVGGNEVGDVEYLRGVNAEDVVEVRYYEAGEAGARFGMGHQRGVIEVIMGRPDSRP